MDKEVNRGVIEEALHFVKQLMEGFKDPAFIGDTRTWADGNIERHSHDMQNNLFFS